MVNVFQKVEELKARGLASALCVIVATKGSTPLKTGAKMLVDATGKIYGTIGGGNFEKKVIDDALLVIINNESKLFEHHLLQEHGMCCGGTVMVYIESVLPSDKLYIFGSGHVGRALAEYASTAGFEVHLIDSRLYELNQISSEAIHKYSQGFETLPDTLKFDGHTYIAIMTHDHSLDRKVLLACINQKYAYLGLIGSRRKVAVTKKMFLEKQYCNEALLEGVDMPMGLDIQANGPEEIAISILAKLIQVKNNKRSKKEAKEINPDPMIPAEICKF